MVQKWGHLACVALTDHRMTSCNSGFPKLIELRGWDHLAHVWVFDLQAYAAVSSKSPKQSKSQRDINKIINILSIISICYDTSATWKLCYDRCGI